MKESGAGKLYEANGFLVPVLTGSPTEMGVQYGGLMVEYMQKAYDLLVEPGRKKGMITDDTAKSWTERIYTTGSIRYRQFYDGLAEATGWTLEKVGMLDNLMEFIIFQAKMMDSFAGCTSILSWGSSNRQHRDVSVIRNSGEPPAVPSEPPFTWFQDDLFVWCQTSGSILVLASGYLAFVGVCHRDWRRHSKISFSSRTERIILRWRVHAQRYVCLSGGPDRDAVPRVDCVGYS